MIQLASSIVNTPLGEMLAISDENYLYFLEFTDRPNLEYKKEKLRRHSSAKIIPGKPFPIDSIVEELGEYFGKKTKENFKTPLFLVGTDFQTSVWSELRDIPYGHTKSYAALAIAVNRKNAYRAAANANGANPMSIVIPCHRVVRSNTGIGGYNGGIERKRWLLNHENVYFLENS